jgi:cytochrome P450
MAPYERSQLGAFLTLRRNPLELWGPAAYEKDILAGKFFGRQQLMLNAPDAIKHVLVTNAENYGRNSGARRVLQPLLGSGLFLADGAAWRHQRRTIAPSLAPRSMPMLARHVVTASVQAETALARTAGQPVLLMEHLQHGAP